jgi:hypothetical protein
MQILEFQAITTLARFGCLRDVGDDAPGPAPAGRQDWLCYQEPR